LKQKITGKICNSFKFHYVCFNKINEISTDMKKVIAGLSGLVVFTFVIIFAINAQNNDKEVLKSDTKVSQKTLPCSSNSMCQGFSVQKTANCCSAEGSAMNCNAAKCKEGKCDPSTCKVSTCEPASCKGSKCVPATCNTNCCSTSAGISCGRMNCNRQKVAEK